MQYGHFLSIGHLGQCPVLPAQPLIHPRAKSRNPLSRPALRGGVRGGDDTALSCTKINPPVLVGTSSIFLALPPAAKLTHFAAPPLQPTTATLGRGLVFATRPKHGVLLFAGTRMLPRPPKGHTAAHRRSREAFLLSQEFRHPLALCGQFQLRQLAGIVLIDYLSDRPEGE